MQQDAMSMEEAAAQIENLEIEIAGQKTAIQRAEMLKRLEKNPDFKALITEGFLEKHAVRQVLLKAHPGLQGEPQQKMIDLQMAAIGGLKQFFVSIFTEGNNARQEMEQSEETLQEILREQAAGKEESN